MGKKKNGMKKNMNGIQGIRPEDIEGLIMEMAQHDNVEVISVDMSDPNNLQFRSSNVGEIFRQMPTVNNLNGEGFDSSDLADAIHHKWMIYDESKKRIIAFSQKHGVLEIDDDMRDHVLVQKTKDQFDFTKSILDNPMLWDAIKTLEKDLGSKNVRYPSLMISEVLGDIEKINACMVNTKDFNRLKKEAFSYIKKLLTPNGDDDRMAMQARLGLMLFAEESKDAIPVGIQDFGKYKVNMQVEKEYLRRMFMVEMFEQQVISFEDLEDFGIIDEMDLEEVEDFFKANKQVSPEEYARALMATKQFASREEYLDYYLKHDRNIYAKLSNDDEIINDMYQGKVVPRDIGLRLTQINVQDLDPDTLAKLYSIDELPATGIVRINSETKERVIPDKYLEQLNEEQLVTLLASPDRKYATSYNAEKLIDLYGTRLGLESIFKLQEAGQIGEELIIELAKYKSLEVVNPDEYQKLISNVADFYDYNRLTQMIETGKLTPDFVNKYNNFMNGLSDEKRKEIEDKLFEDMSNDGKGNMNIARLVHNGIDLKPRNDYQMNYEQFEDIYMQDELEIKDIIKLYQLGLIDRKSIHETVTDEELYDAYEVGEIGIDAFVGTEMFELLVEEDLETGKINLQKIMELYSLNEELDIKFLESTFDKIDISDEQLSEYIPDNIDKSKVEELFVKFYISHDEISNLVSRGIISQKEADEYAKKLEDHAMYEEMFKGSSGLVRLTETTIGESRDYTRELGGGTQGGKRWQSSEKIDPDLKEKLLTKLGFKGDKLRLVGTQNTLDGYTICPSEELGVVIFINTDKPQNATYVMSLQQGMYWIKKIQREVQKSEQEGPLLSEATKGKLRETEHIKVRNDCAGWGRNMVNAIKALSPEKTKEMLKDKKYGAELQQIVDDITKDYERNRDEF